MTSLYDVPVDPDASNNPHSAALRLVGSGHRVLEVGCAGGHVTRHLVAAGNTVVGLELDAAAAEHAREWAEVHVADIDRTPASSLVAGPFDVVLAGDVLEHLRDPLSTLRDLVGLLGEGGRAVVSVPNIAHIDARLMLLGGRWSYQDVGLLDRTHLRFFTRSGFRELLASAGLVTTAIERVEVGPLASKLDIDPAFQHGAIRTLVEADPDALTFQFVVEARPTGDADPDVANMADVLGEPEPVEWPEVILASELTARPEYVELREWADQLAAQNEALQREVAAWKSSKLARATRPARTIWAKLRRGGDRT